MLSPLGDGAWCTTGRTPAGRAHARVDTFGPFPGDHVLGTGSPVSLGGCINDPSSSGFLVLVSCRIAPFVVGPPDDPPTPLLFSLSVQPQLPLPCLVRPYTSPPQSR